MYAIQEAAKHLEEQSKKAVIRNLEEFFKQADKDNSGTLTLTELSRALQAQGYKGTQKEIAKFFSLADQSGDQEISFEEYIRAMGDVPMKFHSKAAMNRVFALFDRDGNGKIDKRELMMVFKEMGKEFTKEDIQRMMDIADTDQSGYLEYEEFIDIVLGSIGKE